MRKTDNRFDVYRHGPGCRCPACKGQRAIDVKRLEERGNHLARKLMGARARVSELEAALAAESEAHRQTDESLKMARAEADGLDDSLGKRVTELEVVVAAFIREHDDDGPDSEFGSPTCACETCAQARAALAGGGDAAGRLLASQTRAADLETALAALLDAAERQAAGFPLEAEQWFAVRDYARARLPEKGKEEVARG